MKSELHMTICYYTAILLIRLVGKPNVNFQAIKVFLAILLLLGVLPTSAVFLLSFMP